VWFSFLFLSSYPNLSFFALFISTTNLCMLIRDFIYSAYVFLICQPKWLLWLFGRFFCSDRPDGHEHSNSEWEGVMVSWDITYPCVCAPGNYVFLLCCPQLNLPLSCSNLWFFLVLNVLCWFQFCKREIKLDKYWLWDNVFEKV
jgi:hypothetical protein